MRKKTTNEFINDAFAIHGDKYDYSETTYSKSSEKVKIICRKHGVFLQQPNHHLSGNGCEKCGGTKLLNTESFVIKAIGVHGNSYAYENTKYKNNKSKVKIECAKHGLFYQTPAAHLSGQGCPKCAVERRSSKNLIAFEKLLVKFKEVHASKYDYSTAVYQGRKKPIRIVCFKHGAFSQIPDIHLSGSGCQRCSTRGFQTEKQGFVYFLISDNFVKVGICHNLKRRLTKLKRDTPFTFTLFKVLTKDGAECLRIEKYFKDTYPNACLNYFDGYTEWFSYSKDLMNDISTTT